MKDALLPLVGICLCVAPATRCTTIKCLSTASSYMCPCLSCFGTYSAKTSRWMMLEIVVLCFGELDLFITNDVAGVGAGCHQVK